ncbi:MULTISPECIES: chemotaxis protein CheB [unclassified Novosphingobium]|uniref:chemotaxis protein CheB n=1 Tax=unclassified Novosphingobium TaxID=2644732 RepID=UPI000F5DF7FA|nr:MULTISPECIES: chemotaxis protein CheB [unclassified Novosphingobium]MBF5092918.1 chemotaxis protein CheB [Novosphingobium sp. NBM11]RQW44797.1 chemotaxis protein CheB [Novosphingobium sp. LASN5T]
MTVAKVSAVAIGASAGAVQALLHILPPLPAGLPVPVMIVVHVPPDRDNMLVPLLKKRCALDVKEAEDKEPLKPGTVYFAPSDYHLLVEKDRTLALSSDEPVNYSRPAIDVLLESAAEAYGHELAAIVLTGSNHDGAEGLRAVTAAGGIALVEDPQSAMSGAMPAAALALCPDARVETLDGITAFLAGLVSA